MSHRILALVLGGALASSLVLTAAPAGADAGPCEPDTPCELQWCFDVKHKPYPLYLC